MSWRAAVLQSSNPNKTLHACKTLISLFRSVLLRLEQTFNVPRTVHKYSNWDEPKLIITTAEQHFTITTFLIVTHDPANL